MLPRALLWLALSRSTAFGAPSVSCHIHPPGSTPERPFGTIGPFESFQACEKERAMQFGPDGRCHCSADFSPRWLPPTDRVLPGQSPLG
jgi:hypothetical protein